MDIKKYYDWVGANYSGPIPKGTYMVKYKDGVYISRPENKEKLDEFIRQKKEEDVRENRQK